MKSGDEPIIGQWLRGSGQATPLTTALLFTSLGRRSLTWSALDPTQVPIELSVSKDASSKPDYRFASWAQRIRRP